MRLSLKTRQVVGVTLIVGLSVVVLSALHVAHISRVLLEESASRARLLANTVFQQATVVAQPGAPHASLQTDLGIQSILQSGMAYSQNVTYAAIVDAAGVVIAHSSPVLEGEVLEAQPTLDDLLASGPIEQLRAIYSQRTFEMRERLLMDGADFGSIRIGLSMSLVRIELERALAPAAVTALAALGVTTFVAMLFAQWLLRPIHVLRSGLSRLGRGEFDVKLDLPPDDEFADLGRSFNTVSEELASVRSRLAGQSARFESVVDRLEDAVAIVDAAGEVIFANRAMRKTMTVSTGVDEADGRAQAVAVSLDASHPFRPLFDSALESRASAGPSVVRIEPADGDAAELLATAHAVEDRDGRFVGVMLVARDLGYLSQVQSTIKYSRKLASLNRLLAGVAHEVKNPLNAMTIHLELLKQKLSGTPARRVGRTLTGVDEGQGATPTPPDVGGALRHVGVIGKEIRRLDEVVQGFLKFSRPEEIDLRPVGVPHLLDEVRTVVGPQASAAGIDFVVECAPGVPPVQGDAAMLKQAVLNLALNACDAMAGGGRLRIAARGVGRLVELVVDDTGPGIPPEHLDRVFDLYFTTKDEGSGIGLSMVYRTVQLHDGEIEVESTVGSGTLFRMRLPRA
jgi:PAS domain S-box-containing protein